MGRGFCKRAFNCKWIRNNEIPENDWKICRYNVINPLVCCRDPMMDETRELDCKMNIFTFAQAQLCFGEMKMRAFLSSNNQDLNQTMARIQEMVDSELLTNEIMENSLMMDTPQTENGTPTPVQMQDDIGISQGHMKLMSNVELKSNTVPQDNNKQQKQFHVIRQPGYNFGYISFIRQY